MMKSLSLVVAGLLCLSSFHAVAASPADDLHFYAGSPKAPFSRAVRAGRTLYLSGQIGASADGTLPKAFDAQAKQVMDNISATMKDLNVGMDRIAKCTVFIADMKNWPRFNEIYMGYFTPGHMPARSALGASGLAMGAALEVECIAWLPEDAVK